nr:molybdopterin-synthase adenylyltransferase MoeB [Gallaecimonas mangrovi]
MDFERQEALLASRVLVIGMGGLGSAVAPYLVASGVGALTLVDDDNIELSNLQRQVIYREADLGKPKAQQAAISLGALNRDVAITAITERLDESALSALIPGFSVVVDCCDNLVTRNAVNRVCFASRVPLVSGSAIRMEGQIASFSMQPGQPCYQCLSRLFGEQSLSCMEAGVLSPVVGVVGTMQALEAIKIITGIGKPLFGVMQLFDAQSGQWQQFTLPRDPNCPVCSAQ